MLEFNNNCGCDSGSLEGFTDPSCPAPSVVTWASIQGKPSCFTPCPHTHVPGDIIGLETYIQNVEFANAVITTNSIQLTTPSGVLNANLRLSANAGTGYKVPLSILSDGLIGQIPFASGSNAGILSAANWTTFNNKFNTPSGTVFQYVRGDGSLATFPTFGTLSSVGITMPAAFGVANSPLTSNGTIVITALGTSAQYIRGDGTLATLPSGGGTVTSVGLSMPAAFTVTNSPVISSGVLTVTAAGTISQYIRGDGTLATFPASPSFLVGSVPFGNGTGLTENNPKFFWDNTLFKLKLTDSKLEFLNSSLFGSALLEYKLVNSVTPMLVYDQTDSGSNGKAYLKINCFNNEGTANSGQQAGVQFGLMDPIIPTYPQTVNDIGIFWNTPRATLQPEDNNKLFLKNLYNTTGKIEIAANRYVSVLGVALPESQLYAFPVTTITVTMSLPKNTFRFAYGGTSGTASHVIYLPASSDVPDGYIAIIKAIGPKAGGNDVQIGISGPTGTTTGDPFTFTLDYQSVIYRYDEADNHWDLIAKN